MAEGLGSEPSRKQEPQQRLRPLDGSDFLRMGLRSQSRSRLCPNSGATPTPRPFSRLVFCVAGVILAVAAIRASIRRKRFGQTYFEFASLPFSPGQPLKGTIHLRFDTRCRDMAST